MTLLPTPTPLNPRPKLVLFDLDRTLADYDNALLERTRYAFAPSFASSTQLERAVAAALAHSGDGSDHFEQVLADHGVADPAIVAAARNRYVEDRYRGLRLFADAREVVEAISRVAAVGLVTNGPTAIQHPKIERLQIATSFPTIVVSEDVGFWKPDPAIFAVALKHAGVAASDAIYVGDSAEHDIPGARAARMRAVWINRLGVTWPGGQPPDAEIRDLYQLLPLLGINRSSGMEQT